SGRGSGWRYRTFASLLAIGVALSLGTAVRASEAPRVDSSAVSLPVRFAGAGLRSGLLRVQEDRWIPRIRMLLQRHPGLGPDVRPASLGDRTGLGAAAELDPRALHGCSRCARRISRSSTWRSSSSGSRS